MRVAVYNRFMHSRGGGERHSGMLARVLAADGNDVEIVTHAQVDLEAISRHLDIDLTGVGLRIVEDRLVRVETLSESYDLFVNASHLSRLKPRARRNMYLCFFPTPVDHELSPARRFAARTVGRWVRAGEPPIAYRSGWYPREGGRRVSWMWTDGDAVLSVPSGRERRLRMTLGRPGGAAKVDARLIGPDGREIWCAPVGEEFAQYAVPLGDSKISTELRLVAPTFLAPGHDGRTIGVAVRGMHLSGTHRGVRARVAERFPWMLEDGTDRTFVRHYARFLANSEYTRRWIRAYWRVDSDVLYPPVGVRSLRPGVKERRILHVGRFFEPRYGHCKRQLELVEAFGRLARAGHLQGWSFELAGGCEDSQLPYLERVRRAAHGLPVTIHPNAPRPVVDHLFATSSIFWAATGLGERDRRRPWALEHFGIATVEAMAAGCVPVVIDKGGQSEIVHDGVEGFLWESIETLQKRTIRVAHDDALRSRLAVAAIDRAQDFSDDAFADRWHAIAQNVGLDDRSASP